MKKLRTHVRELQLIENEAADKAGMRFQLLKQGRLLNSSNSAYIKDFIRKLEYDITPEALAAVKMGKKLAQEVLK